MPNVEIIDADVFELIDAKRFAEDFSGTTLAAELRSFPLCASCMRALVD